MVRLIRTWIDIIAEQPAFVRALLLVLFLAMLSLYVLGIASLVAASRYTALAAVEPTATSPAIAVERTVLSLATQIAANDTPTPVPTTTLLSPTQPASFVLPESPTPAGTPTRTPTLEATPTQARAPVRIAPPPEPSVAPSRPIAPAPIVIPSPLATGTPGTAGQTVSGTPNRSPTVAGIFRAGTGTPAATAAGTRTPGTGTASAGRTPDPEETPVAPTPTVRLGAPTPNGSPIISFPTTTAAPFTPGTPIPLKPIAATPTVRR